MTSYIDEFDCPEVKEGDRVRVLLYKKGGKNYTDGGTVIFVEDQPLMVELDDAEVHNNRTERSYPRRIVLEDYQYRLFREGEPKDGE